MSKCRLCGAKTFSFAKWKSNEYERCPSCKLIQLTVNQLPDEETEIQEYRLHNNDSMDKGYRRFLSKIEKCVKNRPKSIRPPELPPTSRTPAYTCFTRAGLCETCF